jgi:hypothetical protein
VKGILQNDVGSWANGIKLTSDHLLYQLLTQFLPRLHHNRNTLRPPFLDARLQAMRACRVDAQRHEWHVRMWCAEPPQGIQTADALYGAVVEYG